MKISVIGLGYIGLPTATMFASRRIPVVGVDVSPNVVDTVNQGQIHIVEPELDMLVHAAVSEGFLRATLVPEPADAFLVAVPTPFADGYEPDLRYVRSAALAIAPVLKAGDIVILESTSPVGTTEQLVEWLAAARPDLKFPDHGGAECDVNVAYCPERVLPGQVVRELVENDRIIGGITPACAARANEVYRVFVQGRLIVTNARTAEMCKLTENAFRDVNIAFANELSVICDKLGIDVWELIRLANHHPRVNILKPGCGVGGHCIAVDPWFVVSSAPDEAKLIRSAREINDAKPEWVLDKIDEAVEAIRQKNPARHRSDLTIACYGLAFKPNIDDLRESPALHIVQALARRFEGNVLAVEPHIQELPQGLTGVRTASIDGALAAADVNVVLVAHNAFMESDALRAREPLDFTGIFATQATEQR
jgi:UDP-N-acetyl-D-mannosaminuronic acid dehydrogenase